MTLKQEFLDMMQIIAPNITDDSYEEECTLTVDKNIEICGLSGDDVTYDACFDCQHCDDNRNCIHRINKHVDVYLCDFANRTKAKMYLFNTKLDNPILEKSIKCINSHKQLLSEITELKSEFDKNRNDLADYAERIEYYKNYVNEFVDYVKSDFSLFEQIDMNMIPVVFDEGCKIDMDGKRQCDVGGDFQANGIQSIIHIYDSWTKISNTELMKKHIRHELIHYLLWCVCPMCLWHKDEHAIFNYFCDIYDGGAYVEMNKTNQNIFNVMKLLNKDVVNEILVNGLKYVQNLQNATPETLVNP